jgi:ribonuclease BN (tRNA processing enzyme)
MVDAAILAADLSPDAGLRSAKGAAETIKVVELDDGSKFRIGDIDVTAAANSHYVASPHLDPQAALSFRFDAPGKSITYTGDTGPSDAVERLAAGSDLLVSEIFEMEPALAIFRRNNPEAPHDAVGGLRKHFEAEHLSPAQVGILAERAGVKSLVLTHNPTPPDASGRMRKAVAKAYKGSISFAEDMDAF